MCRRFYIGGVVLRDDCLEFAADRSAIFVAAERHELIDLLFQLSEITGFVGYHHDFLMICGRGVLIVSAEFFVQFLTGPQARVFDRNVDFGFKSR